MKNGQIFCLEAKYNPGTVIQESKLCIPYSRTFPSSLFHLFHTIFELGSNGMGMRLHGMGMRLHSMGMRLHSMGMKLHLHICVSTSYVHMGAHKGA